MGRMNRIIKTMLREALLIEDTRNNMVFLGYHSSDYDLSGFEQGEVLDVDTYADVLRNTYLELISDGDEIITSGDPQKIADAFEDMGYTFTYVSSEPIMASPFQSCKYKYGDYLFKVYGDGSELKTDDYNEINAEIILTKKPLYFELVDSCVEDDDDW
jgi:hypothetical protein